MNNLEQLNDVTIPKKDKMHMARVGQLKMIKAKQLKIQKTLQKYDFEQLANCSDSPREKRRLLALASLKNEKNIQEVADELKVSYNFVSTLLRNFKKTGLRRLKETRKKTKIYKFQKKELQKYDFEQLANHAIDQEEKRRLLGLAYLNEGKTIQEVANILRVCKASVYSWVKCFDEKKLKGLKKPEIDRLIPEIHHYDFEQLAQKETHPRNKLRLLALAYLREGKNTTEVANALQVSRTAIYRWIKKFNQNKLEELKEKKVGKPKLEIYNFQKEKFQKYDFEKLAKNATNESEKRRLLALAYLKEGKDIQEVANELKVSTQSIYHWIKRLNKDGLKGLKRSNRILQ